MGLQSRIPEIAAALDPAVHAATLAGAQLVADDAKRRVPYDEELPGPHLRDAIHVEPTPEGAAVLAGNNKVFWGNFVEHGGAVNRPPHPFLVPALEENREEIERVIADALRKVTE